MTTPKKYERAIKPIVREEHPIDLFGKALAYATQLHKDQVDKSGRPYIEHVVRVAANCSWHGLKAMTVGALHDVVEDTDEELMLVEVSFGTDIADAVDAITHRPNEPRDEYLWRVKRNGLARVAKMSDLADNLSPHRALDDERAHHRNANYRVSLRELLAIEGWAMDKKTLAFFESRFENS